MAAVTRWRRASYSRVSRTLRTGTPMVRRRRVIACSISAPRGSVKSSVKRSSKRSGSRCKSRGRTGSSGRLASEASTSKNQRSCATRRFARAAICSCSLSRGERSRPVRINSNPAKSARFTAMRPRASTKAASSAAVSGAVSSWRAFMAERLSSSGNWFGHRDSRIGTSSLRPAATERLAEASGRSRRRR